MSASTVLERPGVTRAEARFEAISAELAELCGQQTPSPVASSSCWPGRPVRALTGERFHLRWYEPPSLS